MRLILLSLIISGCLGQPLDCGVKPIAMFQTTVTYNNDGTVVLSFVDWYAYISYVKVLEEYSVCVTKLINQEN